jgi:hypothetical protein
MLNSILEYATSRDAELAMKDLDGRELRGKRVEVTMDDMVRHMNHSVEIQHG